MWMMSWITILFWKVYITQVGKYFNPRYLNINSGRQYSCLIVVTNKLSTNEQLFLLGLHDNLYSLTIWLSKIDQLKYKPPLNVGCGLMVSMKVLHTEYLFFTGIIVKRLKSLASILFFNVIDKKKKFYQQFGLCSKFLTILD